VNLLLLPGMDGTGLLFEPLLRALPAWLRCTVVSYPTEERLGYAELLPLVEEAVARETDFVVLGESFSGPLALMAARKPPGLRGVILCASFIRNPLPLLACLRLLVHPLWFKIAPLWLIRHLLFGRYQTAELCRMVATALAVALPETLAARARAVLSVDSAAALEACAVPILYLRAKHDRVVPPHNLAVIRRLKPRLEMFGSGQRLSIAFGDQRLIAAPPCLREAAIDGREQPAFDRVESIRTPSSA